MPFMLVALLIFALLVTLAGFFLSFKPNDFDVISTTARVRQRNPETEPIRNPRYRQSETTQYSRSRQVTRVLPRSARSMSISSLGSGLSLGRRGAGERAPWYIIVIGLVSVFVLGLFAFSAVFPRSAI